MKQLAPGVYSDDEGTLHLVIPELAAHLGRPEEELEAELDEPMLRRVLTQLYGARGAVMPIEIQEH